MAIQGNSKSRVLESNRLFFGPRLTPPESSWITIWIQEFLKTIFDEVCWRGALWSIRQSIRFWWRSSDFSEILYYLRRRKEVMLLSVFLCLSVCLSVRLLQKVLHHGAPGQVTWLKTFCPAGFRPG